MTPPLHRRPWRGFAAPWWVLLALALSTPLPAEAGASAATTSAGTVVTGTVLHGVTG